MNPGRFEVRKGEGRTTITGKDPVWSHDYPVLTMYDNPLWFQRFECKCRTYMWVWRGLYVEDIHHVFEVDRPVILKEVPEEAKRLPEGVKFKHQPGATLRILMKYL